jgi:hypothetical protein
MRLDASLVYLDQSVPEALLLQLPALEVKFQILPNQRVSTRKLLVVTEIICITLFACHAQLDQAVFIFLVVEAPRHSRAKDLATELETRIVAIAMT